MQALYLRPFLRLFEVLVCISIVEQKAIFPKGNTSVILEFASHIICAVRRQIKHNKKKSDLFSYYLQISASLNNLQQ